MKSTIQIIISMIIWGSVGIFVKYINMPSLEIAFMRAAVAAVFLLIIGIFNRKKNKSIYSRKNLLLLLASGAAIGLNWVLLFQSYKYTTISNATLSYYFAPVFIMLLSPIVLKEKLTPVRLLSVFGALAGLFLILSNQSNVSMGQYNHRLGMVFGVLAAVLYAGVVLLNKYIKDFSGFDMTFIQITTAALVLLPFIISRGQLHIEGSNILLLILVVGIVHTGIAYLIYFSAIKNVKAQSAAILSYIDPVSAILFGTLILSEPVNIIQILGGLLILGSTFVGEKS
ncbi:MAG: transporter [Clostridiales bacterium]|jgi:RarD protein|nr:transporter [Clostridiales bacterium]